MENEIQEEVHALSRKDFLSLTGKSLIIGSAGSLALNVLSDGSIHAQTKPEEFSPPARVPASIQEPIVLEQWKSAVDQQSGPTPTPLPPNQRVGYAVVGLGHLALEEILPALSSCKRSRLVALVSGNPEKLNRVAQQYGIQKQNCYSYQTFDKIKDNKSVDVIYIVLPNGLHKEYVIRSASAGKHVLCEKPMANSAQECRDMIAACSNAGVKLMVAYRIQFQPHNRKIKELIQKKAFGEAKYIEASNSQSTANVNHWRHKKALAGGGALPDIGLYCLNTTRFVLGLEPLEVFAYQYSTPGNPLFAEVEEMVSWQMLFENGIVASCTTDYDVHESRHYRVNCKRGWLNLDKAYAYNGQKLMSARADGMLERQEEIGIAEIDQFGAEMDHFSTCIIENKKPFTPGEEGLQDHIIMEAIYQSAQERRPIKINGLAKTTNWKGSEPKSE